MEAKQGDSSVSDEVFIAILIVIGIAVVGKYLLEKVFTPFLIDVTNFWNIYKIWIYLAILLFLFLLFLYLFSYLVVFFHERAEDKLRRKLLVEKKIKESKELLDKEIKNLSVAELKALQKEIDDFLEDIRKYVELNYERILLLKKEDAILKRIPLQTKREEIEEMRKERYDIQEQINRLKEEKSRRERAEENDKQVIYRRLKADEKEVFKESSLNKKEIKVLLENNFRKVNEYCLFEKKLICVFVKPSLNHTTTHTFLVWSTKRLLDSIEEITNVKEHFTRDADLTFDFNKRSYAIEVEIGNLLRKPKQMREKKAYLDKKYKDRWMFIVSNQGLLNKYKKFGLTTTRKTALENLNKMLKI